MLWECDKVQTLRREIQNNMKRGPVKTQLGKIPHTAKARLLGTNCKESDSIDFVFLVLINRYIWITKLRENTLNLQAFKGFYKNFMFIQKEARILKSIKDIEVSDIWISN